jgi:acetylornithine deacetylase/succinyl-diaminopimelate desuccinylase family protein
VSGGGNPDRGSAADGDDADADPVDAGPEAPAAVEASGTPPAVADRRGATLAAARALIARASETPPGEEAAVADWLVDRLATSPVEFDVERSDVAPGRPNVLARAGDPARGTVLLTGHTDVVPADPDAWTDHPYEPVVRDGRLVGRGAADMKGALAAMLVGAERYLTATTHPGEVVLAFVVDEEDQGAGTAALVEDGIEADCAVLGEPTELNVSAATKGVARYEVTVEGESCHSGTPDAGRDAVRGLHELLARIAALDDDLAATNHPVLAHEDATVTEVSAGTAPNVVADRATVTVDWRFLPGETDPTPFDARVRETVGGLTADDIEFGVAVDRTVFARGAEVAPDHPAVEGVLAAAQECGLDASVVGFNAATDARFLIHDAGIPTVHFGPGSITDDAHTVDESVAVDDLVAAAAVYEAALGRLL